MSQKRLLILGGTDYQIGAIQYARRQGHHVVTCDYLPDNPGHRLADEYYNVSTTDLPGVLALAQKLRIDGILAFASDPAAPTAAFVADKMGLPGNPYESVVILTNKHLFRKFLHANGFHSPRFGSAATLDQANEVLSQLTLPVLIKPVDSSGSKGVRILQSPEALATAFDAAMAFSRAKRVILEQHVAAAGYQVAGDGFVQNGQLTFRCFANEHFSSERSVVPIGESFPSVEADQTQQRIHAEVQRLLSLLKMKCGALNFDIRLAPAGQVWLMEIGPRAGGMLIPEMIEKATGTDLTACAVNTALGLDGAALTIEPVRQCMSSFGLHSLREGVFKSIELSPEAGHRLVETRLFHPLGSRIPALQGSHGIVGICMLRHESLSDMLSFMQDVDQHILAVVE